MYTQRLLTSAAVLIAMTPAISSAQTITSAHSGLLHYFDGSVAIDDAPVEYKPGKFSEIRENSVLRTGQGRAEILLTPGVYLRVGENTEIKMLDNRLLSTRVGFISGSMILESNDPLATVKDPAVTIVYKDYQVQPMKYGIFELKSDPAQIKVYRGQADAMAGAVKTSAKQGRMLVLSAALLTEKFDEKRVDDLYLWARDRGADLSAANMASARSLSADGGVADNRYQNGTYPGLGFNSGSPGAWYLNQNLGMYTYVPYSGTSWGPFGYGFFSPGSISSFYSAGGYTWYGGGGAPTASFIPQPVSGTVVAGSGLVLRAPGRLNGGHSSISVPVAGSNSGSVASARIGGFYPGQARSGGDGFSPEGNRFGETSNGAGLGTGNSRASIFGGGAGSAGIGGLSGGRTASGSGHAGGGGGSAGGGHSR